LWGDRAARRGCCGHRFEVRASICLETIDISGQFDDFLVSSRAPSGLCQVDSASGGSMRRNVWFGRGGGGSLVERGGNFWTGADIPSSTRADCGLRGRFFSLGNCELTILAT
jgi:hypothetical protein